MTPEEIIARRRAELLARGAKPMAAPAAAPSLEEARAAILARGGTPTEAPAAERPDIQALLAQARAEDKAGGLGALQGATLGFGDEVTGAFTGALQGGVNLLPESVQRRFDLVPASAGDAYRFSRDEERRANAQAEAEHFKSYLGGNLLGSLATGRMLPGAGGPAKDARLGQKLLHGLAVGGAQGAVSGFGTSGADLTSDAEGQGGEAIKDTLVGGAVGGGLGALFPALGAGARAAGRRLLEGVVRPNEAAIFLRSRGVPLTLGQMRPESALSQVEESAQSVMGIGSGISGQRGAAAKGWQNALLNEALAPGSMPLDHSRSLTQRMEDIAQGFNEAYALPKAVEVLPQTSSGAPLPQALANALDDPNAFATEETQKAVSKFLNNQLSLLPQLRRAEAGGRVPAETLMSMRSNIREAMREAGKARNFEREALLGNAEEVLTDALNSQLPEEMAQHLQATDRRYSLYRTLQKAVARAGGKEAGFTPFQVESALKSGMEAGRFARGKGGGEFRDLIEASRNTIEGEVPKTGVRALTMGDPIRSAISATGSYVSNLPRVQPWMLGEAPAQQALRRLGRSQGAALLREALPEGAVAGSAAGRALLPTDSPPPTVAQQEAAERAAMSAFLSGQGAAPSAAAEALRRRRR